MWDDAVTRVPDELWLKVFDHLASWEPAVYFCFRVPGMALPAIRWARHRRRVKAAKPMHAWGRPIVPRLWLEKQMYVRKREWRRAAYCVCETILLDVADSYIVAAVHALSSLVSANNAALGRHRRERWRVMNRLTMHITTTHHAILRYTNYALAFEGVGREAIEEMLRLCLIYVTLGCHQRRTVLLEIFSAALSLVCPGLESQLQPEPDVVKQMLTAQSAPWFL